VKDRQRRDRISDRRSIACPGNETCRPKRRHVAVILLVAPVVSIHASPSRGRATARLSLQMKHNPAFWTCSSN